MMLAVQLWAGYLATHPGWLITIACVFLLFTGWTIMDSLTEEKPSPAVILARRQWEEFATSESPPAADGAPRVPAGDVPGPASHPSPGTDGAHPSAVRAAGPGTPRNGPPWEPIVHEPTAAPTGELWGPGAYHHATTAAIGGE